MNYLKPRPYALNGMQAIQELSSCESLSDFEKKLHGYNYHSLVQDDPGLMGRIKQIPCPKVAIKPSIFKSLIPNIRIELLAEIATYLAICVLKSIRIDLKNPPTNSWDAQSQLTFIATSLNSAYGYSKSVREYFKSPIAGFAALIASFIAVRIIFAILSYITSSASYYKAQTRSLSEEAKLGQLRISSLYGREKELEKMIKALNAKHPIFLVGQTGIGKTALVEALALAIHRKEALSGKTVLLVNAAELVGNGFKWDDETKSVQTPLDALIKNLQGKPDDYIIFIDEIQAATGTAAIKPSSNLIETLKSRLDGSAFPRVIIATTSNEYREKLASDAAFFSRFATICLDELEDDKLMHMLSSQHSELFDEEALHSVIETLKQDEDRVVALPRAALHLIESVTSHLKTFRENRDLTQAREALSQALAEQQKHLLNGEEGLSIQHLEESVSKLEKMDAEKNDIFGFHQRNFKEEPDFKEIASKLRS